MRIRFQKLSNDRHALEVVRDDGRRERVECETRSYLLHDLLHYAVESEAGLRSGFWGILEAGRTLAEVNDREKPLMDEEGPELATIEQIVGALHNLTKGRSAAEVAEGIRRFAHALGATTPHWLNEAFIAAVQERMRRLNGHWNATPFGGAMELEWPDGEAAGVLLSPARRGKP